jgi:cell division protein ZapA
MRCSPRSRSPRSEALANVTLSIGGRSYTVACAPGEETHVRELARTIEAKVAGMGDMAGQGETRVLLFAALLLADELHEKGTAPLTAPVDFTPEWADRLETIADALENLADRLETGRDAA